MPWFYTDTTAPTGGDDDEGDEHPIDLDIQGDDRTVPKYNVLNYMPPPPPSIPEDFEDITASGDFDLLDEAEVGDIIGNGSHYVYIEKIDTNNWSTLEDRAKGIFCSQVVNPYEAYRKDLNLYQTFYTDSVGHETAITSSLILYRLKRNWKVTARTKNGETTGQVALNGVTGNEIVKSLRWGRDDISLSAVSDGKEINGISYRFDSWTSNVSFGYSDIISQSSFTRDLVHYEYDATFTVNYFKGISIDIHNHLIGRGEGGTVTVNDTLTLELPLSKPYLQSAEYDLKLKAMDPTVIDGIRYIFDHWEYDGGSSASQTIILTPAVPITFTAYYRGVPVEAPNLRCASDVGENITLAWDPHPNENCTFQVWCYAKNKLTNSETRTKIADNLPNSTLSYTDGAYKKTSGYTNYLLKYDVRAYYPVEQTVSPENYRLSVFGNLDFWNLQDDSSGAAAQFEEKKKEGINVYPNPFNPSTNVELILTEEKRVRVEVYDIRGALISRLADGYLPAGSYRFRWLGVTSGGKPAASGVYLLRVSMGEKEYIKRMIMMK